jgi:hypothetical protein
MARRKYPGDPQVNAERSLAFLETGEQLSRTVFLAPKDPVSLARHHGMSARALYDFDASMGDTILPGGIVASVLGKTLPNTAVRPVILVEMEADTVRGVDALIEAERTAVAEAEHELAELRAQNELLQATINEAAAMDPVSAVAKICAMMDSDQLRAAHRELIDRFGHEDIIG